jgi:hypothetical protein
LKSSVNSVFPLFLFSLSLFLSGAAVPAVFFPLQEMPLDTCFIALLLDSRMEQMEDSYDAGSP